MGAKKKETREEMRRICSRLDPRWMRAGSNTISQTLEELVRELGSRVKHILAWYPYFVGEVDLSAFIGEHLDTHSVYLPRCHEDGTMTFVSIGQEWTTSMEVGFRGIPEPSYESGIVYENKNAEESMVLVPGLGFTLEGARLGRGRGFYDKFLSRSELSNIVKVGVCWHFQVAESLPSDDWDVRMDWIVDEEGRYRVK